MNIFGIRIRLKQLITLSFVSFGIIWGFFEAGLVLQVIAISDQGAPVYYFGLIAFSIFISIIIAWYTEWRSQRVNKTELAEGVKVKLNKLVKRFRQMIADGSYFKLIYLDWRMQVEWDKTQLAGASRYILDAEDVADYILSATYNILNRLGKSDEYITLSNIDFWGHIRNDLRFFNANIDAVNRQNVHIKRIVLVDIKALEGRAPGDEIKRIREIVKILHEEYQRNTSAFESGKMDWHFYISENYKPDHDISVPYAIITNKISGECLAILPKKKEEKTKPKIEMYFSENKLDENISSYLADFERIAKAPRLIDIPTFYHELFSGKWKNS